jgi:Type I phosphodiesterase / nucleotide pyrophosphatase
MARMRTWGRRTVIPVIAGACMFASLLVPVVGTARAASSDQALIDRTCALPASYLRRTLLGWSPDRSGEITWITRQPNFVGSGLPHAGPWDYIQDVPMLWYGPGVIRARGEVARPVTLADVAPTQAALLGFDGFNAIDGAPMTEALVDPSGSDPPKLVVVLVWDAGGLDVLQAHPGDWPYLRSLIPKGTYYANAAVGSSPTSTAQDHATIGAGAFPIHHGLVGHHFQVGGQDTTPWQIGPNFFMLPTFADVYDQAMGNKPVVGAVATADIHLGMLGHGSFWHGGDRDIAVTRSVTAKATLTDEGDQWNLPKTLADYYELAGYANDVRGFARDKQQLDRRDGKLDGKWRGNDIEQLLHGFDTPARTPYQERVVESVIHHEGFGKDSTPDLFYANFKEIDYISHVWSMNSPEMSDAVVYQDAALKRFVAFLDHEVGTGNWAMVLTADHGAMPDPNVSGGFQVSTGALGASIESRFDTDGDGVPVVDLVQPSNAMLNVQELEDNGSTLDDVATYVQGLTQADTAGGGVTPQPGHEQEQVFQAVFPTALLTRLPCLPEAKRLVRSAV